MPNWCYNRLTIEGEQKDIDKFKKKAKAKDTDLSLNKFVPIPKEQTENWYDWNISNWGTKWDVDAELVDEWEECLCYEFSSAWSPPVVWLETVSRKYPALEFRLKYEEEGNGFLGVAKSRAGATEVQEISL